MTYKVEDGYKGSGTFLKKAFRKYGKINFSREIICFCTSEVAMRQVERALVNYLIDNYSLKLHYNRAYGGTGAKLGKENHFYGRKHSDYTKALISAKNKLNMLKEDNHFYGKKHTPTSIKKMKSFDRSVENNINVLNAFVSKSSWWWCTPWGCFYSDRYASQVSPLGLGRGCIKNWCSCPDKVVKPNYQIPEEYWGHTWRENGYYKIKQENTNELPNVNVRK